MKVTLDIDARGGIKVDEVRDCDGTDMEMLVAASIRRGAVEALRRIVGVSTSPQNLDDLISEGRSFPRDDSGQGP